MPVSNSPTASAACPVLRTTLRQHALTLDEPTAVISLQLSLIDPLLLPLAPSAQDYPETERCMWVLSNPAQLVIVVSNIFWCQVRGSSCSQLKGSVYVYIFLCQVRGGVHVVPVPGEGSFCSQVKGSVDVTRQVRGIA